MTIAFQSHRQLVCSTHPVKSNNSNLHWARFNRRSFSASRDIKKRETRIYRQVLETESTKNECTQFCGLWFEKMRLGWQNFFEHLCSFLQRTIFTQNFLFRRHRFPRAPWWRIRSPVSGPQLGVRRSPLFHSTKNLTGSPLRAENCCFGECLRQN